MRRVVLLDDKEELFLFAALGFTRGLGGFGKIALGVVGGDGPVARSLETSLPSFHGLTGTKGGERILEVLLQRQHRREEIAFLFDTLQRFLRLEEGERKIFLLQYLFHLGPF